jgi:hypothetical protein
VLWETTDADAPANVAVANEQHPQMSYRRLYEELAARLITRAVVTLRSSGAASTSDPEGSAIDKGSRLLTSGGHTSECCYAGAFPLVIGREASCHVVLREAGVSRQHAELAIELVDGCERFCLRDRQSKNGTAFGGVRVTGTVPLGERGELGLGEHCTLRFRVSSAMIILEVTRGLDRGRVVCAGINALDVDDVGDLEFVDGRPRLSAKGGRLLYLNGVQTGGAVQLIRGDVVELGERRIEVID